MNLALFRTFVILLVMHSCTTGTRFTATLDAIDHGATPFAVGAMLSSVALFPAFFAIAAGRWLDRVGSKKPLWLAFACVLFAGSVALMLPTNVVGIAPLFVSCFLVGMAFLLTNTVVQRLAGDFSKPENRTTAFAILSMVTAASGLVTPVVTGYVIEAQGFKAFYAYCVGASVLIFLVSLTPLLGSVFTNGRKTAKEGKTEKKGSAVDFLKLPDMRAVLVASVFISVAWEVGNLMIPVYCRAADLSASDIGWILGSFSAASFCVRLLMPYLMHHLQEWTLIALTMLVAGTAFFLFPLFSDKWSLMGCAFILGMGLGASLPNLMSLLYRLSPPDRIGEAIGLRLMMMNISKASFPAAMGALGSIIGAGSSLLGLGIFLYLGFAIALRSKNTVIKALDRHVKGREVEIRKAANTGEKSEEKHD